MLLFKGQIYVVKRSQGWTELASAFQRAVFFGNARKNNLEIPLLLIVLKEFKEFVQQDLLTEFQKLYIN